MTPEQAQQLITKLGHIEFILMLWLIVYAFYGVQYDGNYFKAELYRKLMTAFIIGYMIISMFK